MRKIFGQQRRKGMREILRKGKCVVSRGEEEQRRKRRTMFEERKYLDS